MKSTEFLQAAIDVQAERGKQYDSPEGERSMGRTVQAFNAITGRDLTEAEGWLLLQVLKDVRQWQNPGQFHHDSALDCVAYASLKGEALSAGGEHDGAEVLPSVPDGWIEHDGKGCPVKLGVLVELRHRDGTTTAPQACTPSGSYWRWVDAPGECCAFDIVAYRLA